MPAEVEARHHGEPLLADGQLGGPIAPLDDARQQRQLEGADALDGAALPGAQLGDLFGLARLRTRPDEEHARQILAGGERRVEVLGQQIDADRSRALSQRQVGHVLPAAHDSRYRASQS